ncbi:MAG TPA: DUF1905 domain-containing protein [Sphingomicrobium sp.]
MITVTSELWLWSGGSWHFITVPEEEAVEIRAHSLLNRGGFGSVKVEATIKGIAWRTSVFPQKSGGYLLPVKKEVRCRAGIAAGDSVTVSLELL